ncbi:MAG: ABC transporter ATP-binding protein [Opitutae bacterium]|nr:ABC transporter ATP-binding protein [Opitutae bacterium]
MATDFAGGAGNFSAKEISAENAEKNRAASASPPTRQNPLSPPPTQSLPPTQLPPPTQLSPQSQLLSPPTPLLSVRDLHVDFRVRGKLSPAVRGISFDLHEREILAIVGESGSGKTATSQALTGLLPEEPACVVRGSVLFCGREILGLPDREIRKIRGKGISYIFQDPQSSLNPVYTIGAQIEEVLKTHGLSRARGQRVREVLRAVGIDPARAGAFPCEFSGGMLQRVMIAMAIVSEPKILVADEPTTALDVTVQKQIMDLILSLRQRLGMSVLLITHNFGLVAEVADRVCVFYRGEKVEEGAALDVALSPRAEYTRRLLSCVPRL